MAGYFFVTGMTVIEFPDGIQWNERAKPTFTGALAELLPSMIDGFGPCAPRIYAMNGISPLWQHAQAYRNPQVRTRPKTRRPWKCRQRLRYRQHPRNHRRHRSRHKIQVIRNVRRPSILSLRALNPRMGRRAQLPIPVTTKARVKSFPRRIRCRIFVSSRSPIPRRKPNNVSLSPSCRKWNAH